MNTFFDTYGLSVLLLLACAAGGIIIEKIVLKILYDAAKKTKWQGDDIIIASFKNIALMWGISAGIYFGSHELPVAQNHIVFIDKIVFAFVVLSLCIFLSRILVGLINLKTASSHGAIPSSSIITNIIRISVYVVGGMVFLQTLGISVAPILTAMGVGGLAVALALQDTLANLFAGIQVLASRQIKVDDYIKLDTGEEGYVADISWRNTTIRALPNNLIIVPNSKISSAIITNYCLPQKEMSVLVQLGVSYDSDLKKVEEITMQTAKEVLQRLDGGVKDFQPFIRYHTFSDFSINFTVILRGREFVDQYLIKHEFIKALHIAYMKNNIEIPFPIRTVIMNKDKNKIANE